MGNVRVKLTWIGQMYQDIRADQGGSGGEKVKSRGEPEAAAQFVDGGLCPQHVIRRTHQKGEVRIEEAGGKINHKWGPFRGAFVGRLRTDRDIESKVVSDRVCGSTTD